MYWKGNTSCNRQNEVWCFVVSDKQCRTVYCPHPTFTTVVWNQLLSAIGTSHGKLWQAEGKAPAGVLSMIILPCQRKHLFSILITSLRRFKLLVNTLKDGTDAKAEEQTSPRAESYHAGKGQRYSILFPACFCPFGKTAPINWLHCGMKLLFEATMVRTVQQCGPRRLFWWRKWSCCLLLAGTNKFIQQ